MNQKLLLLTLPFLTTSVLAQTTTCSELFFSEYVEGSSQNKALEIYNPTNATVDLSQYAIKRYGNGSTGNPDVLTLMGTVAPFDVFVVTNGQLQDIPMSGSIDSALYNMADMHANPYPDPLYMNGNDAITLEKGTQIVDIIGEVGVDPGTAWTDMPPTYTSTNGGTWWTANHTLIRKASVTSGVTSNPSPFIVTLEWDSLPENTWTNLGSHSCDCDVNSVHENANSASVVFFPNPVDGDEVLISSTSDMRRVSFYNVLGEVVLERSLNGVQKDVRLNVTDLTTGIYLVRTELAGLRSITQRLTIR